jgi:hypothetical protein
MRRQDVCKTRNSYVYQTIINHFSWSEYEMEFINELWEPGDFNVEWYRECFLSMADVRVYTVSPGLSEILKNTSIRGLPDDLLKTPYPVVYLVLGGLYEGIYITDHGDCFAFYLVMVSGDNHVLRINKTGGTTGELLDRVREGCMSATEDLVEIKFAVNAMIYATHPDVEELVIYGDDADHLRKLYSRASQERRPEKRDQMLRRAEKLEANPRTLLGGSIRVTRNEREAMHGARTGDGNPVFVQTFVGAHWQHYWTGTHGGERTRVYRLRRAFWRGPKDSPISNRAHNLGGNT